jgi:hypothetical protein
MRQPFILTFSALAALSISAVAHAEFSRSGQTLSAALAELQEDINGMNNILASVTSKETAEAAAPKLREQASRFYTDYQKVKQLKLSDTPTSEEEALLNQQALEIQLAQAAFEQHCLRLVENQFYESAALARFFQAMVNVYQGQNTAPAAPQQQEEEYTPEQKRRIEERKKRDKERPNRLKHYQKK